MRIYQFIIFVFVLSLQLNLVNAQGIKEKKVVEIDGVKYLQHEVKPGETVFSLCKEYKIDSRELINLNPKLMQGLKAGDILKIPYSGNSNQAAAPAEIQKAQEKFIIHEIQRRETPFFVSKKYGISIDDIYKYNPGLKKFKRGEKIRIPQFGDSPSGNVPVAEMAKETKTQDVAAGSEMIEHRVKPDETLTSISKKYNLPISEILSYNPNAQRLKIGMVLKLPNKKASQETAIAGGYFFHTIESGETLYGLTKKYNISESVLKELNPVLKNGFPAGTRLKIPASGVPDLKAGQEVTTKVNEIKSGNNVLAEDLDQNVETIEVPEGCRPANRRGNFSDTYHIGLLLPLFLEANDTLNLKPQLPDTLITENIFELENESDTIEKQFTPESQIWKFYGRSENFLHFYEGVLLAVDSMRNRGMNVKLHVYDTGQDKSVVENLVTTDDFLSLDLIIGPIYPELQKPVSDFSFKNRIPMVSPLSPDGKLAATNPYYFQVFPSQEFLMQKTAQYIADKYYDSNFIVLKTGTPTEADNMLVDMCREKLFDSQTSHNINKASFRIYDFNSLGGSGIPQILSNSKENVFIIPSVDEGQVSFGISNINNNTADFDITVIGNSRYKQFESINQEYFHNTKLKYFYPYWTDFRSPATISFFGKFRYYFSTEPTQYSMQGYDVAFFFMNAFWDHGKNFYDCLPYMDIALTQGNYKFEKVSKFGGYMNQGVSLISYTKDYMVVREKTSGEVKYIYK